MRTAPIATAFLLALSSCGSCGSSERDLWVVNNSGVEISIAIDGKDLPPPIPSGTTENPASVRHVKVKPGDHFIETRFADGRKTRQGVMFSEQTSGYVFAPRRDKALCFFVVGPDGEKSLDRDNELLGLPHVLDRALEPTAAAEEHTLRMKPCGS
jgi:hypothetical protein